MSLKMIKIMMISKQKKPLGKHRDPVLTETKEPSEEEEKGDEGLCEEGMSV